MNIARQHASGLLGYFSSIALSFEPLLSNSKRSPRSVHLGARHLMTLILVPPVAADLRTFSLTIVGVQFRSICLCDA